jgi:pimeloyl-ACP methyl ester carboxylesterase
VVTTETAPTLPPRSASLAPRRGPIRWIVATSLGVGLVAALVLVLVVFAGAREHVVTGSALLGFALGWALLAILSIRLTTQPQRWAFVPAAGMAATGLGLLVLAPGDGGLTAAGWVWPAVLLALAVWMAVRIRRDLAAGCGRRLLFPVVVVMAVAAVGGMAGTVAVAGHRTSVAPGQSYDVGGYRLHLDCTGSGGPTVVLLGGLGSMSSSWARIAPAVSRTTRVCAYDRAGQGWSDDSPHAPDGLQAAADLHTLLGRAGEEGPYVLVGHSSGGSYAMAYAARHPQQVAGVVLLDGADPYQVTAASTSADANAPAELALLPSLARLGIGQLVPASVWSSLPEPAAGQIQAFTASPRSWRNVRDEFAAMPALFGQAQALTTLGSAPLVVLTAGGQDADPRWSAAQERMAALSTNSSHRRADATHNALLDEERGAQASRRAIEDVIQAVRTGTPLQPA